jgi:hypothetical protein
VSVVYKRVETIDSKLIVQILIVTYKPPWDPKYMMTTKHSLAYSIEICFNLVHNLIFRNPHPDIRKLAIEAIEDLISNVCNETTCIVSTKSDQWQRRSFVTYWCNVFHQMPRLAQKDKYIYSQCQASKYNCVDSRTFLDSRIVLKRTYIVLRKNFNKVWFGIVGYDVFLF